MIATGLLPAMLSGTNSRAGRGDVGGEPAGTRDDDGAMAGAAEDARQRDRAGIGGADIERGHDDQRVDRIARGVDIVALLSPPDTGSARPERPDIP